MVLCHEEFAPHLRMFSASAVHTGKVASIGSIVCMIGKLPHGHLLTAVIAKISTSFVALICISNGNDH